MSGLDTLVSRPDSIPYTESEVIVAKRLTIQELKRQLVFAEERAADSDWMVRMQGRDDVRKLKARIARREKDEALRSMGMTSRCPREILAR